MLSKFRHCANCLQFRLYPKLGRYPKLGQLTVQPYRTPIGHIIYGGRVNLNIEYTCVIIIFKIVY